MDSCRVPSVLRPCPLQGHKPEVQILWWRTERKVVKRDKKMVFNFWSISWSKSVAWDFGGKSVEVGNWSWKSCKPLFQMHELQINPWVFGFIFWYRVKTQSVSQDELTLQIVQTKKGEREGARKERRRKKKKEKERRTHKFKLSACRIQIWWSLRQKP